MHANISKKPVDEKPLNAVQGKMINRDEIPDDVIGNMLNQLPALSNKLEEACKDVEPQFMQIGHELQEIYKNSKELTEKVYDLVNQLGGDKDAGMLFQMRVLAEGSLAELEGCRKDVSEKTEKIKRVIEHLKSLSTIFPLIKKIGLRLKLVAMNIEIENSLLKESADLFEVVANETRAFSKNINRISDDSAEVLESALESQETLYVKLDEGLEEIKRLGENARIIVSDAIHEIENLMVSTLQIAKQAGDHSKDISREVGQIVVALQFHDNMSQRVEHITMALGDVERLLTSQSSDKNEIDQARDLSHSLSIINLQSSHLKEIISEINSVHEKGVKSFEDILIEIDELFGRLSSLSASPGQDRERRGQGIDPFIRLRSSFEDLNSVVHRGQNLMDPVREGASLVYDTVEKVSGFVKDVHSIGFEAHLMSVNSIVMVDRLGNKKGALEVLAQEIKNSSDQSDSIVTRSDEMLHLITGAAQGLQEQVESSERELSLDFSMDDITGEYYQFMEGSGEARDRADEIKVVISKTRDRLDILPALAERFKGLLHQFEEIVEDLQPFVTEEYVLGQVESDKILGRYTMEKERDVHEATISRIDDVGMSKSIPDKEQDTKGDELGDNVELF